MQTMHLAIASKELKLRSSYLAKGIVKPDMYSVSVGGSLNESHFESMVVFAVATLVTQVSHSTNYKHKLKAVKRITPVFTVVCVCVCMANYLFWLVVEQRINSEV